MIRTRDLAERVFWTFTSGFLGSLIAAPLLLDVIETIADQPLDVSTLGAAAIAATFAGFTAAANVILIIARWRLTILPDPGAGLPGLPAADDDDGATTIELAALTFLITLTTCLALLILLA